MPPRRAKAKRPAAAVKQRFPANYFVKVMTVSLASKADSADIPITLIDNSVDLGGATVHWNKLVVRHHYQLNSADAFIAGVTRQPQGSSPGPLDVAGTIRDLRSQNAWLRGPWLIAAVGTSQTCGMYGKALVLKGLTLDDNDDVNLGLTALGATGANSQEVRLLITGFYRKVS